MTFQQDKFVRFQDWSSEVNSPGIHVTQSGRIRTTLKTVSRKFQRGGVLVEDSWAIAKRYMSSYFLIDILAVLPLPQVVILFIIPKLRGSESLNTKNLLKFCVFFQYVPRFIRIVPLYKEVTRTSGILTETAWAGAAFNLFLYMLASHVLVAIATFLNASCPIQSPNTTLFNFGIFLDALQSGVVGSTDFPQKFFYCFWWGLKNLSSLGQNLATSTFVWEICFAIFISIAGLVLFAFLIGNMQTYLQSTTTRLEEMRVKRRDAEQWMSHRLLPDSLRERIRRHEQYKWQETRGVDEDNLIRNLPKDLRRDIKRHLCLALLMRVPIFEKMDEQLLDAKWHKEDSGARETTSHDAPEAC
ncbi:Cyclic nucleotide-gated ion channel 1 [Trifolium repens]|nr:Cyclic nucleotide-gated ion channel 1 [Trifolium repens]